MRIHNLLYINGAWVPPSSDASLEVRNAATEEVIARVPAGTSDDVELAVRAARAAFGSWAATPVEQRSVFLQNVAGALAARADEIARIITAEVGMPLKLSQRIQAALPPQVMESYARLAREYRFEERVANSLVIKEPVGVVGSLRKRTRSTPPVGTHPPLREVISQPNVEHVNNRGRMINGRAPSTFTCWE